MQAILDQLIKIVLALVTLITTYAVGQGVVLNAPASTDSAIAQLQSQVQTQVSAVGQQGQTSQPTAPAAPANVATAASTTGATATASASSGGSVAVGGVTTINAATQTTTQNEGAVSQNSTVSIGHNPIMNRNVYGARSYKASVQSANAIYVAPNGADSNSGTKDAPFGTIQKALDTVVAGQTVYIRGGTYALSQRLVTKRGGTVNAGITITGYPGETPIIDATQMDLAAGVGDEKYPHDLGAFWITNDVAYVHVANLTIKNSPSSGISVCKAKHITIEGNTVNGTYSPGISTNSTYNHNCQSEDIKIFRNTLINTNNLAFGRGAENDGEAPHEAISIMGTNGFEIAYNYIHDTQKEGIDVKERSKNGVVHHNLVENIARQCFYVDAWYGVLENIEWYANIGRNCGFMGFAISVENGSNETAVVSNVSFHHNLLDNPQGTGIYFSRFSADGLRKNIKIYNNTLYHAGYNVGWIVGGLALLSDHLKDVQIYDNIFADNAPFQMGVSTEYGGMSGLTQRAITLKNNLINGPQEGGDMMDGSMQPIGGVDTIAGDPLFANPAGGDFTLKAGSPAIGAATDGGNIGAF